MKQCECGCGEPVSPRTRSNKRAGYRKGDFPRFRTGHFSRTAEFRSLMAQVDPETTKHVGADNPQWKGGRRVDAQGYIVVRTGVGTEEREHRVVAAQTLGRPLRDGEVVHHKNGNRADNRPENLEVFASQSEHMREHMTSEEARERGTKGGWNRRAALLAVRGQ